MPTHILHGGIDAGGTTFKCGVADAQGKLLATYRVPVSDPASTIAQCADFFHAQAGLGTLQSFGIASFGPLDVDPHSPHYGTILHTPKPGWAHTPLRAQFEAALKLSVAIDTDVNGALLAEMESGAARGAASAAYMTIGTGIGAGLYVNGALAGRPFHPEFGHIPLRRHADDARFDGTCPFHGDCLEGLASVTAVRARWGDPEAFSDTHPAWAIIADYLAQAARVLTLSFRPERIVLGGGLMLAPHLLGHVRTAYDQQMAGYLGAEGISGEALLHTPGLGDHAGLIGAIRLGRMAQGRG